MGITELGRETANDSQSGGDYGDDLTYERFDVSGLPWVQMHPTVAVGGSPVALRYFPGDPNEDEWGQGYHGLVLDDPFVVTDDENTEGTVIVENAEDSGSDYKIANLDDDSTEFMDERGALNFDGHKTFGDIVDDFGEDRVVLKLSGSAGRRIARVLDLNGEPEAGVVTDEDGEPVTDENGAFEMTKGLIEYHPEDESPYQRFARDTELRPDVTADGNDGESGQVAVLLQRLAEIREDYEGDSYWATVLQRDGEDEEFDAIQPTEGDPSAELMSTSWLQWTFPDVESDEDDE